MTCLQPCPENKVCFVLRGKEREHFGMAIVSEVSKGRGTQKIEGSRTDGGGAWVLLRLWPWGEESVGLVKVVRMWL